jgi:hypothetical protein
MLAIRLVAATGKAARSSWNSSRRCRPLPASRRRHWCLDGGHAAADERHPALEELRRQRVGPELFTLAAGHVLNDGLSIGLQ